jgi:hypothetical protein
VKDVPQTLYQIADEEIRATAQDKTAAEVHLS